MTRRIGLFLVAAATAALTFATSGDAEARGRRNGSFGSNGSHGSYGSYGSNGSFGSFGGRFSRRGNGSNGSYGSYGSNGGYGSCGSHGGAYDGNHEEAAPEESNEGEKHEAGYRGERTLDTNQPTPAREDQQRVESQGQDRAASENRDANRDSAGQPQADQNRTEANSPDLNPPQQPSQDQQQRQPGQEQQQPAATSNNASP